MRDNLWERMSRVELLDAIAYHLPLDVAMQVHAELPGKSIEWVRRTLRELTKLYPDKAGLTVAGVNPMPPKSPPQSPERTVCGSWGRQAARARWYGSRWSSDTPSQWGLCAE